MFYKPVAVESREVIIKMNGHVIRLIPKAVCSSVEQPVKFYVDGTEVPVNEGESKYKYILRLNTSEFSVKFKLSILDLLHNNCNIRKYL